MRTVERNGCTGPIAALRPWASRLSGNRLQILAYHSVMDGPSEEMIPPALFAEQMGILAKSGWRVISLEEALSRLEAGEPLRRLVVLTFDDAYADFAQNALPVLDRHRFPATLFAVTERLGVMSDWNSVSSPRMTLSLAALVQLHRAGYTLGSHSATHPSLTALSAELLEQEVGRSRRWLEEQLGLEQLYFAYPFGRLGGREICAVRRAGYSAACATGGMWGTGYETDRFALDRFVVGRRYSLKEFETVVMGRFKWPLLVRRGGDAAPERSSAR
ncbi:MAG: polysaccharide deacetylase family protein [Chloroflexota bacterium]